LSCKITQSPRFIKSRSNSGVPTLRWDHIIIIQRESSEASKRAGAREQVYQFIGSSPEVSGHHIIDLSVHQLIDSTILQRKTNRY